MNQHIIPDLSAEYVPAAVYLDDADSVEYVRRDVACVYRRVDGILTLVLDMKTRKLNGFRLKGFKNFFLKHLQPKYKLVDDDFVPLVSAIEEAIQLIGDQLMNHPERKAAYREARRMAHDDRVCIEHMEPLAA
jgi:hypothetical protein